MECGPNVNTGAKFTSRQLLFKCNQVLIKKEAGKGQTDRALLAVYSSDKGWGDGSPPEALDLCVLVCVYV